MPTSPPWKIIFPRKITDLDNRLGNFPFDDGVFQRTSARLDVNQFKNAIPLTLEQATSLYYNFFGVSMTAILSNPHLSTGITTLRDSQFTKKQDDVAYFPRERNFNFTEDIVTTDENKEGRTLGAEFEIRLFGNYNIVKLYDGTPRNTDGNLLGWGLFNFMLVTANGLAAGQGGGILNYRRLIGSVGDSSQTVTLNGSDGKTYKFVDDLKATSIKGSARNSEGELVSVPPPVFESQINQIEFFTYSS